MSCSTLAGAGDDDGAGFGFSLSSGVKGVDALCS
jgi:hypothetical protein